MKEDAPNGRHRANSPSQSTGRSSAKAPRRTAIPPPPAEDERAGMTAKQWVITSAVAFLFCLLVAILLVIESGKLQQYGLTGALYYLALVAAGLSAAGFLFGALHAYATYKGEGSLGKLELGGPAVIFVLVLVLGFYFGAPAQSLHVVIRPEANGRPLRTGTLLVDTGTHRESKVIDGNGEVQVNEISSSFSKVDIAPDIDGYEADFENPITIPPDRVIHLKMKAITYATRLWGTIHEPQGVNGLADAEVSVTFAGHTFHGRTDSSGEFDLGNVPIKRGSTVDLLVRTKGLERFNNQVIVTGERAINVNATR